MVIGAGDFNQCAGLAELLCSMAYIPVGYTCFAVFGFRTALACRWSIAMFLLGSSWPYLQLVLGGKGCATLTHLVTGHYLPQIWDPYATAFEFRRGFASCSEAAYNLGGETLLVASTTATAWVHIMSNFSFLLGFINGWARIRCGEGDESEVVIQ